MNARNLIALAVLSASVTLHASPRAVAIVSSISGKAQTRTASGETRPLQLFDWLEPGTTIEVASPGAVTIAFANGSRYELDDNAKATVGEKELTAITGRHRQLVSVTPLPKIAAATAGEDARPAAFRVRGQKITGLYPNASVMSLANATTLRFDPVPNASRYRVVVEDDDGTPLFQVESEKTEVLVSPGILKTGRHYYWSVRTLDAASASARGESELTTLSEEQAASRNALRKSIEGAPDASSVALLAEMDRSLGLLYEAHEEMQRAAAMTGNDEALRAAASRVDQELKSRTP